MMRCGLHVAKIEQPISARIVQIEGRISSLLEHYAEMQPIFCKDKLFFAENSSLCSIFFINKWEKVCKAVGRKGRRAPVGPWERRHKTNEAAGLQRNPAAPRCVHICGEWD